MEMTEYTDHTPMEWNQAFSLEVPELDHQHQELVNFFNNVLNNCSGNTTEELLYFDNTIGTFVTLLTKHFETEEQLLSAGRHYTGYDEHKLEHTKLLEKIHFIKQEIENNKWEMKLIILARTLKDWLMRHFDSYDISAKEFFRERNGAHPGSIHTNETESYFAFQG